MVYILKYCFKDYESGRPFYAGKRGGQSSFVSSDRFRPRWRRRKGEKLTWVADHDEGRRFDAGKPPDSTRVEEAKTLVFTTRQRRLARRLLAEGFHEGMDRRGLMAAWADVKRQSLDL